MFEQIKALVGKRKKAMNPDDESVRESNETQEYRDAKLRKDEDARKETTRDKMKQGFKKGGSVGSASRRADGAAQRGKTKGRMV